MSGIVHRIALALTLNARNRMAMIYGFAFPLIFLLTFFVLYRHDQVPLVLHVGELLTVTILGGACFGLPTTMVSERERGVWRSYRLTPTPIWTFLATTLAARLVLLITAALLQIAVAMALGMPAPAHPLGLLAAFTLVCAAFLAMGLVIAMIADNVPAVQALGQCIFLPMLIIGGVAVRIESLPDWAQHLSAFFPGRYAVQALQANVTGEGLAGIGFEALALSLIAAAGAIAAINLFRWSPGRRARASKHWPWIAAALATWGVVGVFAELNGRVAVSSAGPTQVANDFAATATGESWRDIDPKEFDNIAFERLPLDSGIVAPVAAPSEIADPMIAAQVEAVRAALPDWPPGRDPDPVQRVRNLLYVAAAPDELQMTLMERFVPLVVFERLQREYPTEDLKKLLYWVAMHPMDGEDGAVRALEPLGLPPALGPTQTTRERVMLYAFKFLGRLTGDIDPDAPYLAPAPAPNP